MSDTVAKRTDKVDGMVSATARMRALMGGTLAMRAAGEAYLPKFEAESVEAYRSRRDSSWLFNGYKKTVRDMSGRVFEKPVELGEATPPQIVEWATNIDNQGNDLSVFAQRVFEDGYDAGISYIMVDAPPRQGTVTRAQAASINLRPYLVHIAVEEVLGWKTETIHNVTTLTQFRIMETVTVDDPDDEFAQSTVEQVRVLDRLPQGVQTRLYRKDAKEKWALYDGPTVSPMREITVVPFYANRTGFFTGAPLLDDLADVNIAHWQSQSDQRNILHFARVPILYMTRAQGGEGKVVVSVGTATEGEIGSDMKWVEHTGAAIGAGRQDLKDLEFQMETHGLQLLVARPGAQSATGEALDAQKETSTLAQTADQLKDTLEQAMKWAAEYGGLPDNVEVTVNKDYGVGMMTAQELAVMLSAVNTGNLSRETFLGEMRRRGMVQADLDVDEELERIEADGNGLMEAPLEDAA